jgi:signal transduction histidine kinase
MAAPRPLRQADFILAANAIGVMSMFGALLAILALLTCAAVAWYRTGRGQPKTLRGRLREFAWCAALVIGVAFAVSAAHLVPGPFGIPATMWFAIAAAILVAIAPRAGVRLVPVGLILFGLYGFVVARESGFWAFAPSTYMALPVGNYDMTYYLVLPIAYALLGLGGWLLWRNASHDSVWFKLALGRAAAARGRELLAFLLLPVLIAITVLLIPVGGGAGGVLAVLLLFLLTGGSLLIRRSPKAAAGLASAGFIVLGLAGLFMANHWGTLSWGSYVLDGFVSYASRNMMFIAVAQSVGFFALGVFLVPQTMPVGRLANPDLLKRIQRLSESRAEAVDTAAADLRRLERDLHDGAQARLVALGMSLRAVERLIPTNPDAALALVAEARETSARALTELRELVRGVHPPVLADRGLGDAIRALALDTPMRIETDIDLPGRVAAPVETACYFAVAEVLTNAAKHSGAKEGKISVGHVGGMLRIAVTDFGVGGADPAGGTGLAGVEKRLASFDGLLAISSPRGGPTIVVIEVPCAISSAMAAMRIPAVGSVG